MLDGGVFKNCPYTSRDLRIARKLFGECTVCLKAKHTPASSIKQRLHRLVAHLPGYRLCIDVLLISYIGRKGKKLIHPYLFSVDDYSGMLPITKLKSKKTGDVWFKFKDMILWYTSYDHAVVYVETNHESVMVSLQPYL